MKIVLYLISFIIIITAPFLGEISLNLEEIFQIDSMTYRVFWDLRVSRVLLAFFVGGILALSGLIFQVIFKNALITPYTFRNSKWYYTFCSYWNCIFPNIDVISFFSFWFTSHYYHFILYL